VHPETGRIYDLNGRYNKINEENGYSTAGESKQQRIPGNQTEQKFHRIQNEANVHPTTYATTGWHNESSNP
jgi:hypothetical protein